MVEVRFQFGPFRLDDKLFALTGPYGPVNIEPQVFELLRLRLLIVA